MFYTAWALGLFCASLAVSLALHFAWHHGVHPRAWLRVAQWAHAHVLLAIIVGIIAGILAGAGGTAGYAILHGNAGLIEPPVPAQKPHGAQSRGRKGMGFVPQRTRLGRPRTFSAAPVPAAVDLSQWAPPVGNQGAVSSCASWAIAYGLMSYYAARSGHPLPRGGAPMYAYSQLAHGVNQGTTLPAVFNLLKRQGVDSRADYRQGDYNYLSPPSAAERRRAARWKIRGFHTLFVGDHQGTYAEQAIKQSIAGGDPVVLGIPVYDNFLASTRSSYYIHSISGAFYGNHSVVAYKYDANGIWVQNQWSVSWGLFGWVELSWRYITEYSIEADSLIPH